MFEIEVNFLVAYVVIVKFGPACVVVISLLKPLRKKVELARMKQYAFWNLCCTEIHTNCRYLTRYVEKT